MTTLADGGTRVRRPFVVRFREDSLVGASMWRLVTSQAGVVSLVVLAILVGAAYLVPPLARLHPLDQLENARLLAPSTLHPFGTDQAGRDLFARVLVGLQVSIQIAVVATVVGGTVGTLVGYAAGYLRGFVDTILMRLIDTMLAFPSILMALVVIAVLGPSLRNATIALALTNVPLFARIARGAILTELSRDYVLTARANGAGPLRIVFRHTMINTLPALIVQAALAMAFVILAETSLSYLGLGVQPPNPSLGNILSSGQTYMLSGHTYYVIFPALVLAALMFTLNLLADALNDALDPRAARG